VSGADTAAFVSGAIAMGYLAAALFFLRFWRDTADRLFGYFALAFGMLAAQRTLLSLFTYHPAVEVSLYVVRALAFVVLIVGILDKNRRE
jgi:hypothetical protein